MAGTESKNLKFTIEEANNMILPQAENVSYALTGSEHSDFSDVHIDSIDNELSIKLSNGDRPDRLFIEFDRKGLFVDREDNDSGLHSYFNASVLFLRPTGDGETFQVDFMNTDGNFQPLQEGDHLVEVEPDLSQNSEVFSARKLYSDQASQAFSKMLVQSEDGSLSLAPNPRLASPEEQDDASIDNLKVSESSVDRVFGLNVPDYES